MTDPAGWQVPQGYGQGYEAAYQWGLAAPPGYEPAILVPRPPRPRVVDLAIALTCTGVVVTGIGLVIDSVLTWQARQSMSGLSVNSPVSQSANRTATVLGIVISGVVMWLLPAAGAVITAVLARRGANAARVVLACLMGLFALVDLCSVAGRAATTWLGSQLAGNLPGAELNGPMTLVGLVLDAVAFGLAVTIGVLLLVPPANRYFRPGPGRRFVDGMTEVPSIYDRP
jgi:hypothetical protein